MGSDEDEDWSGQLSEQESFVSDGFELTWVTSSPADATSPAARQTLSAPSSPSNVSAWTAENTLSMLINTLTSLVPSGNSPPNQNPNRGTAAPRPQAKTAVTKNLPVKELPQNLLKLIFGELRGTKALRTARLVCRKWRKMIDKDYLTFYTVLSRKTLDYLNDRQSSPVTRLIVCDIIEIDTIYFSSLKFLPRIEEIRFESLCPTDYDGRRTLESPTIGEDNLIELLERCPNVHTVIFNNGSLGNFGLGLRKVKKDANANCVFVGWQWPASGMVEKVTEVSKFLCKILGDLDDSFDALNSEDVDEYAKPSELIPSDPPAYATEVTYEEPEPPFSAFTTLKGVKLGLVSSLEITTCPTKTTEKMALIALLHTVNFPSLATFSLHVKEYVPDEALYRSIFKFLAKHETTIRHLTMINPILCTKLRTGTAPTHIPIGLDRVKLRSLTIAWEMPIGLELYWPNGHFLLENQKRLSHLELHSSSIVRVETVICNNFKFLTKAVIDISDTWDTEFDCSCFTLCSALKTLSIHAPLTVRMLNVCNLPDTLQVLHWDALYTREDVRWFSTFLILAQVIYLYHDKDVPMDIFVPFNLGDLLQFLRLPCLEQLYLPRIQFQDPRVSRYCKQYLPGMGLTQIDDMFFIHRPRFQFQQHSSG